MSIASNTAAVKTSSIGMTLTFATAPAGIAAGDYVIVRQQIPGFAEAGWWPGWLAALPSQPSLLTCRRRRPVSRLCGSTPARPGQSAGVSSFADSTSGQSFLQMHGGYTLSFRAKGTGGTTSPSALFVLLLPCIISTRRSLSITPPGTTIRTRSRQTILGPPGLSP